MSRDDGRVSTNCHKPAWRETESIQRDRETHTEKETRRDTEVLHSRWSSQAIARALDAKSMIQDRNRRDGPDKPSSQPEEMLEEKAEGMRLSPSTGIEKQEEDDADHLRVAVPSITHVVVSVSSTYSILVWQASIIIHASGAARAQHLCSRAIR